MVSLDHPPAFVKVASRHFYAKKKKKKKPCGFTKKDTFQTAPL